MSRKAIARLGAGAGALVAALTFLGATGGGAPAVTDGERARAGTDLAGLRAAIVDLAFDTGAWPGGCPASFLADPEVWDLADPGAGLVALPAPPGTCGFGERGRARWRGPYLRRVPLDPWGRPYFFDSDYFGNPPCHPAHALIVVGSLGPGGRQYDCDDVVVPIDLPAVRARAR